MNQETVKAEVMKVSDSKNSLFIKFKTSPFDRGTVGYVANPKDKEYVKGDTFDMPKPVGMKTMMDKDGTVRTTKEGVELKEFTFF